MRKIGIITCFAYPQNSRYTFNPDYVQADLKRVLLFTIKKIGIHGHRLYILTDLSPDEQIIERLKNEYYTLAIQKLDQLGYSNIRKPNRSVRSPVSWLRKQCKSTDLFDQVRRSIRLDLKTGNVIEYASIFSNFSVINGKAHYLTILRHIRQELLPEDRLFCYYTGHGVRITQPSGQQLALVIQTDDGQAHFLEIGHLKFLGQQDNSLIIFDCCYSSEMILPTGLNTIYIASTSQQQTCGFYDNRETNKYGSLFTYFFIQALNNGLTNLQSIRDFVMTEVDKYRTKTRKKSQDMVIKYSENRNVELESIDHILRNQKTD